MEPPIPRLLFALALLSTHAGIARAELVPEDPYADLDAPVARPARPTPRVMAPVGSVSTTARTRPIDATESLVHRGPVAFVSGPLPAPLDADPMLAGVSAGYVCDGAGALFTYVTLDDCRPAAIHGTSFDDSSSHLAARIRARYPEPDIPFWAAHGWKVLAPVLVVVLCAVVVLVRRRRAAHRRRRFLDERTTQFGMSAIDPKIARQLTAAWENHPAIRPNAVVSLIMPRPFPPRAARGTPPPACSSPAPGGWNAPASAPFSGHPGPPAPVAHAAYPEPPLASVAPLFPAQSEPLAYAARDAFSGQALAPPSPGHPGPLAYAAHPACDGSSGQPGPHTYAAHPPYAEDSPCAPAPWVDAASEGYAPAPAWANPNVALPAPYPLTFPAFSDPAPAPLAHARTPGVWESSPYTPDDELPTVRASTDAQSNGGDYAISFARGSQPREELEDAARTVTRRPAAITIKSHGGRH